MRTLCSLALAIWSVQGIEKNAPAVRPELAHGFGRGLAWAGDWDGDGRRDPALSIHDRAKGLVVLSSATGEPLVRFEGKLAELWAPTIVAAPDADGDGVIDLLVVTRAAAEQDTARTYVVGLLGSRERLFRPLHSFANTPPFVVGLPGGDKETRAAWAYFSAEPHGVSVLAVVEFDGTPRWRRELPEGLVPPGVVLSSAPPLLAGGDARIALGLAGRAPNDPWERPAIPALADGGAVLVFDAADGAELGRFAPGVPHVGYGCGVLALPSVGDAPPTVWVATEIHPERHESTHAYFEHVGAGPAPSRTLSTSGSADTALQIEPASPRGPRYDGAFAWVRVELEGASVDVLIDGNRYWNLFGAVRALRLDTAVPIWTVDCPDWERDYGFGRTLAGEEWWAPGTTGGRILAGNWNPYGGPTPAVYELDAATGRVLARHPRAAPAAEPTSPR